MSEQANRREIVAPSRGGSPRPEISVVVACYNAAETVAATLESLRAQTLSDWEAICVDDGSADETGKILREAAEQARRESIDVVDVARPDALETLLRVAQATGNRCIVAPAYELLDRQGRPLLPSIRAIESFRKGS